jgi:hypothetical protein
MGGARGIRQEVSGQSWAGVDALYGGVVVVGGRQVVVHCWYCVVGGGACRSWVAGRCSWLVLLVGGLIVYGR